jgi:hypothetical protein
MARHGAIHAPLLVMDVGSRLQPYVRFLKAQWRLHFAM